jgi:aminopeptidase
MDPRVREHAEVLVDYCTGIEPGDHVVVIAPPVAEDLVVAVFERCGERNANPVWLSSSSRATRAHLRAADPDSFVPSEHTAGLVENADVVVVVRANRNVTERGDVDPETNAAYGKSQQDINETLMEKQWVGTQYPASGDAQKAEMSTGAYADFVYGAMNRDWDDQRAFQERMVEILDPAEEVRIVSGTETDLTMRVAGMVAVNDDGHKNLPGGEVFTAPVPDSVEGTVVFDKPLIKKGREVQGIFLEFEDGEVVEYAAERNEEVLAAVLDTDEGARRLGELGIGMNRGIDRFTYNILFDEKMGDTVHMALGRSIDESVPEGMEGNESGAHVDMIVDMAEDSFVEVDGEVVQRDGTFVFDDGFEG